MKAFYNDVTKIVYMEKVDRKAYTESAKFSFPMRQMQKASIYR